MLHTNNLSFNLAKINLRVNPRLNFKYSTRNQSQSKMLRSLKINHNDSDVLLSEQLKRVKSKNSKRFNLSQSGFFLERKCA
jgi:hypothetical protein